MSGLGAIDCGNREKKRCPNSAMEVFPPKGGVLW